MENRKSISLLIPAFNESETICEVAESVRSTLEQFKIRNQIFDFEIVILNDGSTDKTAQLVELLTKKYQEVKSISNPRAIGLQQAFEQLYAAASMEWSCIFPGDGQWPTSSLEALLNAFVELDCKSVVLTARVNRDQVYSNFRRLVSHTFNRFASFVLKKRIRDIGSIKLVPTKVMASGMTLQSPLQEIERLLVTTRIYKYDFTEVEVLFKKRSGGAETGVSITNLTNVLLELWPCFFLKYQEKN